MDKEEFRIKLEEINKLVQEQDYEGAMNIVDSIEWRRVKNVRTLSVVGEIYAANKRYEESKDIFLLAYHKASIGKNILYRLIEISLRMNEIEEAKEFFKEYRKVAPNDNTQYILKYKILKAQNRSLNEQIKVLQEYKEKEFTEKWSFELAKLYYQAGATEKCLELCDEIILWFSEGKYVTKTFDLKMRMGKLVGKEKERYEQQFVPKLRSPEEIKDIKDTAEEGDSSDEDGEVLTGNDLGEINIVNKQIESIQINEKDLDNIESLQEKISKGIKDIFYGKKKEEELEEVIAADNPFDEIKEGLIPEEIPQEVIQTGDIEEESYSVPELEPEDNVQEDVSHTIKMPELKIPDSMKRIDVQEIPKVSDVSIPEIKKPQTRNSIFSFNLENSILAAATAQGIEIPEEGQEEIQEKKEASEEFVEVSENEDRTLDEYAEEKEWNVPELEEEEFLSEEDLQEAEEEFLNGPVSARNNKDLSEDDADDKEDLFGDLFKLKEDDAENILFTDSDSLEQASILENRELSEDEKLERLIESIEIDQETNAMDIIPREKKLRDQEKQLFTYFVKVPGMKEQLTETLYDVQLAAADKTSKTGNIIVMGAKETGKTRLISSLVLAICSELHLEASKVAYVFAEQINGKDIGKIIEKLRGGFLVIENANQLTQESVDELDRAMAEDTDGLTVIVEDEKIGMRKLIARFPKFAKKFTSMINIPVFTNDELVNFARVYTKENGYIIDQMGMLALYNIIGRSQKEDEPMSIGAVKDLIDAAIVKSQGGIRKLKRSMSKKHTNADGYIVLYENDFSK